MHITRSRGYLVTRDRVSGKVIAEADTFTCGHCNRVVAIAPNTRPEDLGGHCKVCYGLTCPACTRQGSCVPFERQLEASERKDRLRRQIAGLCT
jgi:hypothetical protein